MEEMKNRFCVILSLLFIISITSCATSGSHIEKHYNGKKLLYNDWKYKGFGHELPEWFDAAYKGDVEEVLKKISVPENSKIEIVTGRGINSDQADKSLRQKSAELDSELLLYDSSWALLSEKVAAEDNMGYPYFAAAVFYK